MHPNPRVRSASPDWIVGSEVGFWVHSTNRSKSEMPIGVWWDGRTAEFNNLSRAFKIEEDIIESFSSISKHLFGDSEKLSLHCKEKGESLWGSDIKWSGSQSFGFGAVCCFSRPLLMASVNMVALASHKLEAGCHHLNVLLLHGVGGWVGGQVVG